MSEFVNKDAAAQNRERITKEKQNKGRGVMRLRRYARPENKLLTSNRLSH